MNRSEAMTLWELVSDKDFVREVAPNLDPEHFPRGAVRWLVNRVKELWVEDRSLLTLNTLTHIVEEEDFQRWGTTVDEVVDLYEDIRSDFEDEEEANAQQLRRNVARKWLRTQASKTILDEASEALEAGDLDAMERALSRAAQAGQQRKELTFENAYIPADKPHIRTGIRYLDGWWRGGAHEGQLCCVLAPSNQGKSMILPKFAAEALRMGKNVIYYTTELPEAQIYRRILSAILNQPLPDLDPDEAGPRALRLLRQRQMGDPEEKMHLSIRYRDPGTIDASTIASDIEEKADQGIRIHMIVLDGDDIGVAGNKKWEKMYDQYFHIYGQLSALAVAKDVVIWTAAQATRDSFKRATISPWHVGDSLWKYRKSDLMIAMNSTEKMQDEDNEGRRWVSVSVAKDRYYGSKDRHFKLQPLYGKDEPGVVGYEYMEDDDDQA